MHVVLERVVGVVLPFRCPQRHAAFDHALAKPRIAVDQPALRDLLDPLPVDRLVEQQQRVDHHQVCGPVHV
jgi:hypothetical protein